MNNPKYAEVQQVVDVAGYKMQSEFLNFLHK
jgi:hypothetical protein